MIRAIFFLMLLTITAIAADAPPAVDCAVIRAHVAEHGRAKAIAWARSQGYGWREIWRIKKLCGV